MPVDRFEPDPMLVELALQHRDLVPQGEDLRVLVAVVAGRYSARQRQDHESTPHVGLSTRE
jgi:hypothetical protein